MGYGCVFFIKTLHQVITLPYYKEMKICVPKFVAALVEGLQFNSVRFCLGSCKYSHKDGVTLKYYAIQYGSKLILASVEPSLPGGDPNCAITSTRKPHPPMIYGSIPHDPPQNWSRYTCIEVIELTLAHKKTAVIKAINH